MMLHSWHGDYEKECALAGFVFLKMCHDQSDSGVRVPNEVFFFKSAVFLSLC